MALTKAEKRKIEEEEKYRQAIYIASSQVPPYKWNRLATFDVLITLKGGVALLISYKPLFIR